MHKIRLTDAFAQFQEYWRPRIVGELNGQQVKLAKFQGDFVWHHHADEDELFLVVQGSFRMDYRDADGCETSLDVHEGELVIVPRGTEHRPCAAQECQVLLFEPAGTLNTGNVSNSQTVEQPTRLDGN